MRSVGRTLRAVLGLFVDDGSLAIAILVLVGVAASLEFWLQAGPRIVGTVLFFGCLAVLIENVVRSSR